MPKTAVRPFFRIKNYFVSRETMVISIHMTIWDNIYKNYQKGGQAWATLNSSDVDDKFKDFIKNNEFTTKNVLDIGCGTGKYLVFLKNLGFKTSGIDSSGTATKMTCTNLNDDSNIKVVNMFKYKIDHNKYDLIISVATIHHGLKIEIEELIDLIYESLLNHGKIFITLPSISGRKRWDTFKDDKEVGPGTFTPLAGPEKGLPHSFFEKEEVKNFSHNLKIWKLILIKKIVGLFQQRNVPRETIY